MPVLRRLRLTNPPINEIRNTLSSHEENYPPEHVTRQKSSLDTFVIAGRTRYPSAKIPVPETIDFRIAKSLLDFDSAKSTKDFVDDWQASQQQEERGDEKRDLASSGSHHGPASHRFSSNVRRLYLNEFGSGSEESSRIASDFLTEYNNLAQQHGLRDIEEATETGVVSGSILTQRSPRKLFLGRFWRKSQSSELGEVSKPKLPRRGSLVSLLGRSQKLTVARASLEDICRLSGLSLIHLPPAFRATSLIIPTCLAATGNHLVEHGRGSAGVFRVPGQSTVIDTLYNHYATLMHEAEDGQTIQAAIGSCSIPSIDCSTPDVASAFKRFLRDVPAGILGSLALYRKLQGIVAVVPPSSITGHDEKATKPRLIALALLTLKSESRLALICGVFGLLAYLKQDTFALSSVDYSMTSKAMGVVFAPLLLGDLTEHIEISRSQDLQPPCLTPNKRRFLGKRKITDTDAESGITLGVGQLTAAAVVVEFLVQEWTVIAKLMRNYDSSSSSSLCSAVSRRKTYDERREVSATSFECNESAMGVRRKPGSLPRTTSSSDLESQSWSRASSNDARRNGRHSRNMSMPVLPSTKEEGAEDLMDPLLTLTSIVPKLPSKPAHDTTREQPNVYDDEGLAWWERSLTDSNIGPTYEVAETSLATATHTSSTTTCDVVLDNRLPCENTIASLEKAGHSNYFSTERVLEGHKFLDNHQTDKKDTPSLASEEGKDTVPVILLPTEKSELQASILHRELLAKHVRPRAPLSTSMNVPSMIPRPIINIRRTRRSTVSPPSKCYSLSPHCRSEPKGQKSSPYSRRPARTGEQEPLSKTCPMQQALRPTTHLPATDEPPVARQLRFRTSSERLQQSTQDTGLTIPSMEMSKRSNVGMLYAEISRLKTRLDTQVDENIQLRHELDATRSLRISGTLSEQLRTAEREAKMWKHRAEWAETTLFGKSWETGHDGKLKRTE